MSSSYDLLKDTWIYRDIQHEVAEEFQQQQLDAHRQTLLAIVQARFPRIEALAQQVAQRINEPEQLQKADCKGRYGAHGTGGAHGNERAGRWVQFLIAH